MPPSRLLHREPRSQGWKGNPRPCWGHTGQEAATARGRATKGRRLSASSLPPRGEAPIKSHTASVSTRQSTQKLVTTGWCFSQPGHDVMLMARCLPSNDARGLSGSVEADFLQGFCRTQGHMSWGTVDGPQEGETRGPSQAWQLSTAPGWCWQGLRYSTFCHSERATPAARRDVCSPAREAVLGAHQRAAAGNRPCRLLPPGFLVASGRGSGLRVACGGEVSLQTDCSAFPQTPRDPLARVEFLPGVERTRGTKPHFPSGRRPPLGRWVRFLPSRASQPSDKVDSKDGRNRDAAVPFPNRKPFHRLSVRQRLSREARASPAAWGSLATEVPGTGWNRAPARP